jgi:segregation and condensation protein B
MDAATIKNILEAALLAAGEPLSEERLLALFNEAEQPAREQLRAALQQLRDDYAARSLELREVGSGWRIQVRQEFAPWVAKLWEERAPRYSRALLETLALIAYRQPITRAEIEEIRGVTIASSIMKTLQEREWIRVVGHRDVPGRPALYATTREFLDYFNLRGLEDLPTLAELPATDAAHPELETSPGLAEMPPAQPREHADAASASLSTEPGD